MMAAQLPLWMDVGEEERGRILELLAVEEIRGVVGLAEDCGLPIEVCVERLRELGDLVDVRRQVHGCALVRMRPR